MVLGTTVADENGEWVVVPEVALGAGEHLVSVGAVSDDGAETVADITMAIKVGETAEDSPLVALLPQSETDIPKLLQSPDDRPVAEESVVAERPQPAGEGVQTVRASEAAPAAVVPALAPRSLAWGAGGELVVSGVSRGGSSVAAEAAGKPFGTAAVARTAPGNSGRVDMTRPTRMMRFLLGDAGGQTVATYELPVATRDLSEGSTEAAW